MPTDNNVKKQIKRVITKTDSSALAILFGSRARGNAKTDSDWDILILLNREQVSIKDEQLFRHNLYDLELEIGMPISTFVYSLHDWKNKLSNTPLHKSVEQEGVML